jgi:hypothetical protein
MLSTIGRAAVRRVVAGAPQSTNKAFQSIWHLQHVGTLHNPKNGSGLPQFSSLGRSYATTAKVVSKPRTTKPTANPLKAVAKKAAKKPVKKPVKKVAKKKAVKKPVKKPAKKKILTEEQAEKLALKKLKAKALSFPKNKPHTAWGVLLSEYTKEHASTAYNTGFKDSAAKYKSLSPAELEVIDVFSSCLSSLTEIQSYNHIANQNKTANEIALKQWIESHTPEQIRIANNARLQLKTKNLRGTWHQIQDDRQPKQPRRALNFFTKERHASGDLKGISLAEAGRLVAREWNALSASERKVGGIPISACNAILMFFRPMKT